VDDILRDIQDVVGVTGCVVADSRGQVVKSTLPSVFDTASLTVVSKTLSKTIEGLRMARRKKVSELDLVFEGGRLVVKVLSAGYLFILCVPTINVPLLNLTANVAAKKLSALLAPATPKPVAAPAGAAVAGAAAAEPAAGAPAVPDVAKVPTAELVPQLEAIVTQAMGSDGLELFREELAELGQGAKPSRASLAELSQALYFPAALAVGGGAARKMVDGMLEAIRQVG
jgi:predicted regulator of Ras-like GTPase activity (Roadblock/LC7/MglB family)